MTTAQRNTYVATGNVKATLNHLLVQCLCVHCRGWSDKGATQKETLLARFEMLASSSSSNVSLLPPPFLDSK
eukprot:2981669-Amphidinium_carterae.1